MLALVKQIHDSQISLDTRLTQHMHDETLELGEAFAKLLIRAFPEGDPEGHRAHHEAVIKAAEAKAEFWTKMVFEITRWGLIGLLGWLVVAAYKHFLAGPQ